MLALFAADSLDKPEDLLQHITPSRLLLAALIVVVTVLMVRYIARTSAFLSGRNPSARFALKWTEELTRLFLWFVSILAVVTILSPTSDTFLAAIGSGAIALALGAQDLVKNITGGLVIMADRPYRIGDRVQIGHTIGEVLKIGLRSTKLRTPEDSTVTLANSEVLSGQVSNDNSGVPECQVVTTIYVPADTDPDLLLRVGYECAWCSPYLRLSRPVVVLVSDEYTESPYMRMRIKAYVFDHSYVSRMQSDITVRAKKELTRLGVLEKWNSG